MPFFFDSGGADAFVCVTGLFFDAGATGGGDGAHGGGDGARGGGDGAAAVGVGARGGGAGPAGVGVGARCGGDIAISSTSMSSPAAL